MRGVVHLWLGKAANKTRLNKFLKETYVADDRPISEFAASQGVNFYDHDFMDVEFNNNDAQETFSKVSAKDEYLTNQGRPFLK